MKIIKEKQYIITKFGLTQNTYQTFSSILLDLFNALKMRKLIYFPDIYYHTLHVIYLDLLEY